MPKLSAALLVYRARAHRREVLAVHPGGPFWARKDAGAWSIPKGEYEIGDDAYACALREFEEEIGQSPPSGVAIDLGEIRQPGGKRVRCWAVEGDLDVRSVVSNEFELEWPPRSGSFLSFPEVDRAEWFDDTAARVKLLRAQVGFLDRLHTVLHGASPPPYS